MFRFTIRDVLWLTVVVALAAGWAADHWQPVTTSRMKALLIHGYGTGREGDGESTTYFTRDGDKVTAWDFYEVEYFPDTAGEEP